MHPPIDPARIPVRALFEQHGTFLRGLARALVRDEATAQDLEQETWRAAIEHGGPLREPRAWLTATARRLAWTRHRRDGRRSDRERRAARPEASSAPPSSGPALDAGDLLQSALRALDEPFRGAIVARYLEGLEPREIAARDGVPLETVKSRLKRGLAKLRTELDGRHGGERRAWSMALVAGLGLDDSGTAAASSASLPRSAGSRPLRGSTSAPLLSGSMLVTAFTMKLHLVALGLVASVALVWGLSHIEGESDRAVRLTDPEPAEGLSSPLAELAPIDGPVSAPERAEIAAAAPAAVDTEYSLALSVQVDDEHGHPAPGLKVEVAPAGHPFNVVGYTRRSGACDARWTSKLPAMTVDVAVSRGSHDLVGVQRLEVKAGTVRKLVVRAPRIPAPSRIARVRLGRSTNDREAATSFRPGPVRPECVTLEGGSIGFRWRAFEEIEQNFEVSRGRLDDAQGLAPAVVEGILMDTAGRPAAGYAIRYVEPQPAAEKRREVETLQLTDEEGRFRIETLPGTLRCRVGPRGRTDEWEADVAAGTTTAWNPVISRDRDVMVQLEGTWTGGPRQVVIQVRHDDGTTRWVGRAIASATGHAAILDCPTGVVDVELLAPLDAAALPFATIDAVPTGERWEHAIPPGTTIRFLPIEFLPGDGGVDGASAAELLLFAESGGAGARERIRGGRGGPSSVTVPVGTFRAELAWQAGGATDLGQVLVAGELPVDLGAIPAPALSRVRIPEPTGKDDQLALHRVMDSVDSLVYGSADMWDGLPKDRTVELVPGEYRLSVTPAEGAPRAAMFTVKDGKPVKLELP